jgi:hypothetical protein
VWECPREQQVRDSFIQNNLLTVHTGNLPEYPEVVTQNESSGDSSEEYIPKGDDSVELESEDDEADVLDDESGKETTSKGKKKKKAGQGSLRVAVQAARGKGVEEYYRPSKRKAIEL